jgi:hypothetical protein
VYSVEEVRTQLRSQGQQDDLVDDPYEAVRRTGDHAAIILMTHDGRHAGAKAHLVSGARILKSIPLDSDSVDFDLLLRPVVLPRGGGPVVDRCGRFYSIARNSPAAICRVSHPNFVLARSEILVHDVFSSEDTVFVIGSDALANEKLLLFRVRPESLQLANEILVPVRGSSEFGGLVRVLDLDERRNVAVVQPLRHTENRANETYLFDLKTSECKSMGPLDGDFGFFLDSDALLKSP